MKKYEPYTDKDNYSMYHRKVSRALKIIVMLAALIWISVFLLTFLK